MTSILGYVRRLGVLSHAGFAFDAVGVKIYQSCRNVVLGIVQRISTQEGDGVLIDNFVPQLLKARGRDKVGIPQLADHLTKNADFGPTPLAGALLGALNEITDG